MNRAEILRDYSVDEHGIIRSPGKFEGEMLYVPFLWDAVLNGWGEFVGGWVENTERIHISPDAVLEFPELDGTLSVVLWETEQGFVCSEHEA